MKDDLILLRYSSIDSVFFSISTVFIFNMISAPKTAPYWFIIIFFFLIKKVLNIPNYSAIDCFIFFFQPKKMSYIFNCIFIYFFLYLEIFFTSLIMLSSPFLSSEPKRAFSATKIFLRFLS